jgi:cobalt/nickel transport system permease protein
MSLVHFRNSAEHGHGHVTLIESLDPRVKLVTAVVLAVWVGLVPSGSEPLLAFLAVGLVVIGALARIPPATLWVRASVALPFVLIPGLLQLLGGTLEVFEVLAMGARGVVATMVATLLVSITPFPTLLASASALGVPSLLVQTTALIYRYLHVLRERAAAMASGARARGFGPKTPQRFSVMGAMLGALLVRSLHRAERVHKSMLARGYSGRFPSAAPMQMRLFDWSVGVFIVGGAGASLLWLY